MIARGTVVLTPFPFTDLTGNKVRPAVVVSRSDRPGSDVILAFISSAPRSGPLLPTDLDLNANDPDFARTGLKVPSLVKLDKLVTLEQRVVLGSLGSLSGRLINELNQKLKHALDLP